MNHHRRKDKVDAHRPIGFFAGFLTGSLVGAGMMLLLAPRTGKKTRSQIQQKGAKLRRQATESMEDVVSGAGDKAHQFTDSVHQEVGELQQQAQELLAGAKK